MNIETKNYTRNHTKYLHHTSIPLSKTPRLSGSLITLSSDRWYNQSIALSNKTKHVPRGRALIACYACHWNQIEYILYIYLVETACIKLIYFNRNSHKHIYKSTLFLFRTSTQFYSHRALPIRANKQKCPANNQAGTHTIYKHTHSASLIKSMSCDQCHPMIKCVCCDLYLCRCVYLTENSNAPGSPVCSIKRIFHSLTCSR